MKKLLFLLLALTVSAPAFAQTQTQYYTVPTIAALKAMTTSRPAVVQVVDANPGIFNLSAGACAAADDVFQVQPTSGTTVCYTRAATPYAIGKSVNYATIGTSQTGVPKLVPAALVDVRSLNVPMVCDGTTDDSTAFTAALALVVPLTSGGDTCAISGSFEMPNSTWLENIKFKQLDPTGSAGERRTLRMSNAAGPLRLIDVVVNRNGSPTDATVPGGAAGIYLAGSGGIPSLEGLYLENVEVYGDGPGLGIAIIDAIAPQIIAPFVHGMRWAAGVDPGTEQIFGLQFIRSTNVYVQNPRIENLTGNIASAGYLPYQTDGLSIGGVTNGTIIGGNISNVGEGIDTASSVLSTGVWIHGTVFRTIGGSAIKYGSIQQSGVVGASVIDAGLRAVAAFANSTTPAGYQAKDLMFNDIIAYNTGSSNVWPSPIAFELAWDGTNTMPSNIQCNNCAAINTAATMLYGFKADAGVANEFRLNNAFVSGAVTDSFTGVTSGITNWRSDNSLMVFGGVHVPSSLTTTTRASSFDSSSFIQRYDDNANHTAMSLRNYGITASGQGANFLWQFGTGNALGASAGTLDVLTTDTWAAAGNRSSKVRMQVAAAGSMGNAFEATTTNFTVPATMTATTFSGSGASLTSVPLSGLATQATNTVVGNATSGSASPTALAVATCSTSSSALNWTTNTGFGCNTAINAATLGGSALGTSGATVPLLNGTNTFSGIQGNTAGATFGASTRLRTVTVTGGNYASDTVRFDDNSLTNTDVRQNYGVTASGQGLGILFQYGAGGSAGNTAGTISFPSTDTWAAGANRSSQFKIETITANVVGTVLTGTAAGIVVTGVVKTGGYTVAALPAAPGTGARSYVTDQLTTCAALGAAPTGGGAVTCPVFYNGTAWVGG